MIRMFLRAVAGLLLDGVEDEVPHSAAVCAGRRPTKHVPEVRAPTLSSPPKARTHEMPLPVPMPLVHVTPPDVSLSYIYR